MAEISAVVRSISDFRPPQSWQLLVGLLKLGPYENMGAQLLREVASKTSNVAVDGTTTATVLAEAIFREGLKNVTAGANPTSLQRDIMQGVEAIVEELKKISKKVSNRKERRFHIHRRNCNSSRTV